MQKFYRVTKTFNDSGRIINSLNLSSLEDIAKLTAEDPNLDWYKSLYSYDSDINDYFNKNNTVTGYQGKVTTDRLVFDLDSEENITLAQDDARELLFRLQNSGVNVEESAKIYFSGCKGFHVELPVVKEFEPDELKSICSNIANGLKTFDPVVYNTNRIFRLPNTKHQKTGLYKIELEPYDLTDTTIEQIKQRAKEPSNKVYPTIAVKDLSFLNKFKTPIVSKPINQIIVDADDNGIRGMEEVDFTTCPKEKARCIHSLEHGVMIAGQGQRNSVFLALARYYRNTGMHKEVAYNTLKGISRNNARLYPDAEPVSKNELWNQIITGTYSSTTFKQIPGAFGSDPENQALKFYCDAVGKYTNKPCPLHNHVQVHKPTIMRVEEMHNTFEKYAIDLKTNVVKTGYAFIDDNACITTGTTSLLVGCSGSAKTTMALNILENSNTYNQPSIFFSLDMSKNLVYQKLAQKCTDYTREEILDLYLNRNAKKVEYIRDAISEKYGKTYFDFSKTLTLEQIRDRVFDIEQKTGSKLKFVLLDYVGRLSGPHSDKYANASYNALKTVEMAEVTEAAWLMIAQIARHTGSELTPLRSKRVSKDSSDWEESATTQINIWRPFYSGGEMDDVVRAFLAKNRMGSEIEDVLHFDGAKATIRDMSYSEKANYEAARGEKAEREFYKNKLNKGNFGNNS